jgi:hypothetical protein
MDPGVRTANALALVIRCSCIASDFVVLVLSATVLVLDGCLSCGDADRKSRRVAVTCGPIGRIAVLDRVEYEYEKKHEQCGAPRSPPVLF